MKKITEKSEKLKAEILGMPGVCNNMAISLYCLSASIIHHLWLVHTKQFKIRNKHQIY